MNARTYIAGPMSGYPEHNFPAFDEAARFLRAQPFFGEVVSPAELTRQDAVEHDLPVGARSWAYCMRQDLAEVVECDHVVLLDGWAASRGARLEAEVGLAIGVRFYRFSPAQCDENASLRAVSDEKVRSVMAGGVNVERVEDPDFYCDRCLTTIPGSGSWRPGQCTSGWYHRAGWAKYMHLNEQVLCDACMHADPRYVEDYGDLAGLPTDEETLDQRINVVSAVIVDTGPESVCAEADRLVSEDRMSAYGHPLDNFEMIAARWTTALRNTFGSKASEIELTAEDVALMMIDLKVARLESGQLDHRDSQVDIAGYAKCYSMIREERKRRGEA